MHHRFTCTVIVKSFSAGELSLSGQRNQDHSRNGTCLGIRHEIKQFLSQSHNDPPIFLVQRQPLTLLALLLQPLVRPLTYNHKLGVCQTWGKENLILSHFKEA